ncbi:MAG: helix-turn-helix domain-containing protein [Kofleriaceae bacterium]
MTARVAADYCDTSPWTIRRHIRPCGRRGRSHVFSKESVEAWMRGNPVTVRNGAASVAAAASSLARIHSLAEYRQRRRGDHLADDDNDMQT